MIPPSPSIQCSIHSIIKSFSGNWNLFSGLFCCQVFIFFFPFSGILKVLNDGWILFDHPKHCHFSSKLRGRPDLLLRRLPAGLHPRGLRLDRWSDKFRFVKESPAQKIHRKRVRPLQRVFFWDPGIQVENLGVRVLFLNSEDWLFTKIKFKVPTFLHFNLKM